ncbi:MAG: hypothetical protein HY834_12925 [Devosia nanyangense]|uniref:Uncharacterized protein n=1 Tax=Devosia nanyangense TaxID=1228055 RepID=A0A933NZE6_9HYPH|nr:hypothetical protein [Devosia nanyangense]
MLMRLGALLALGLGGLLAVMPLPRADATESGAGIQRPVAKSDAMSLLLSPAPLSSERFMSYYVLAYR